MKFAKLSLAAIMAMGISAFATDIKVDGDVKVYYGTTDADYNDGITRVSPTTGDMFGQKNSYGDAAVRVGMTAENMPAGLTGRLSMTYLTTMGLEGRLVNGVWAGLSEDTQLDGIWFDEMNLKGTVFDKTTVIAGRQYLDTPMVFSEKWNIAKNSYDAAVVVDQHIEKTALVAAWVWRSNINGSLTVANGDGSFNDGFDTFGDNGAYAFGAVTSLIPYTTAQAWYYSVDSVADAYWLQADIKPTIGEDMNLEIGGQFAGTLVADSTYKALGIPSSGQDDATAWAIKAGIDFAGARISAAYSSTDKGNLGFANVGGDQSKLYTEAWWNYGYVSAPDTDAYNVTAEYSWADVADFGAYYTHTEFNGNDGEAFLNGGITNNLSKDDEMDEFTLTASKSFGAFDASIAYIYTDADNLNWKDKNGNGQRDKNENGDSFNTLQVYLTYNF
ncbi:hypothetical protein [Hydrogenimonas sp. SS33]|uniref:hypothetical protein n=1 Tax=Hydrogenimonas leucolamina TaxID=2954236 RepID=UPI00336BB9BE